MTQIEIANIEQMGIDEIVEARRISIEALQDAVRKHDNVIGELDEAKQKTWATLLDAVNQAYSIETTRGNYWLRIAKEQNDELEELVTQRDKLIMHIRRTADINYAVFHSNVPLQEGRGE